MLLPKGNIVRQHPAHKDHQQLVQCRIRRVATLLQLLNRVQVQQVVKPIQSRSPNGIRYGIGRGRTYTVQLLLLAPLVRSEAPAVKVVRLLGHVGVVQRLYNGVVHGANLRHVQVPVRGGDKAFRGGVHGRQERWQPRELCRQAHQLQENAVARQRLAFRGQVVEHDGGAEALLRERLGRRGEEPVGEEVDNLVRHAAHRVGERDDHVDAAGQRGAEGLGVLGVGGGACRQSRDQGARGALRRRGC
mmetsp:Transcript_41647/g.102469  ORF Transcript_41647/g.102469 Transcript_41647/m.102469 type:complete len:246 (-) Transcript_41647:137-874(-)